MLFDSQRQKKEKRIEIAKRLLKMGGHSKDASSLSKPKYKKARKEADKLLERSAERKAVIAAQPPRSTRKIAPAENFKNGGCVMKGRGGSFKGIS